MAENENFNQQIILATTEREQWFDTIELPKIQESYRLHFVCLKNIFDNLVRASLIVPDPYKDDSKVTQISVPDTEPFNDNERAQVLGLRLSNYEVMIDFICNYMKFSVEQMSPATIKKMIELNNVFGWTNLTENSTKCNTRALAYVINELKRTAQPIILGLLKDSLLKTKNAMEEINSGLKKLAEFKRETYKVEVRKKILSNSKFDTQKAYESAGSMLNEIKKFFPSCMKGKPFYNELVSEIVAEETAQNKEELQNNLIERLKIQEVITEKKETVDTHAIIMEALRLMGSTYEQFRVIAKKVASNHELLQSSKNTFKEKFFAFFRSLFGLPEPPIDYEVSILDKVTDTRKKEIIHYNDFIQKLFKRIKIYSSFSTKSDPGYLKAESQKPSAVLDYLNKQYTEVNHLIAQLVALDDFFKAHIQQSDRLKIKGISMELTTIKNIIVKSNKHKLEYVSYVEEEEQMKKLGIV